MVSTLTHSSTSISPILFPSKTLTRPAPAVLLSCNRPNSSRSLQLSHSSITLKSFPGANSTPGSNRGLRSVCSYKAGDDKFPQKENDLDWPILKRWDVPWEWQTVSLTSLACGLSFLLTVLIEQSALPYLGLQVGELGLDEKAEILFLDEAITTVVVLGVLFSITDTFQPRPDDLFRYDLKKPFDLQRGWLLWAGIGIVGAVIAISLTGVAASLFRADKPQREVRNWVIILGTQAQVTQRHFVDDYKMQSAYVIFYVLLFHERRLLVFKNHFQTDALVRLLPLIGSSTISTAWLVGVTGFLAPLLEETLFRGFLMVSLTKWLPTPVSILISGAVFAVAHLTPGQFPQLFVLDKFEYQERALVRLQVAYTRLTRLPTPVSILISGAVFAVAHLTPGQFPQLFVLGTLLGFSYAQTRNLLTPITIHALWNSGVILLLAFLQGIVAELLIGAAFLSLQSSFVPEKWRRMVDESLFTSVKDD
ncbi:hypothetical protein RHSIM_Rhsim12G0063600 [Rhododendron simsii]|uniref:CAAX prenyl protease 2/Lysostaphin resistance protein A-like domain-containing protein n=1 Tax=Rhododendron simsii TaxID=118357 RepID=A0A834G3U0_RHOSS|nr:hypothetical protein RHSIM_Rhsim12G0063600 [Rhododendron simsii]